MIKKNPGLGARGKLGRISDLIPSPTPLPLSIPDVLSRDALEYMVAEVEQAAWRIRNSTNPVAIENAKQLLREYELTLEQAEEIGRAHMKSSQRNRRRG